MRQESLQRPRAKYMVCEAKNALQN